MSNLDNLDKMGKLGGLYHPNDPDRYNADSQ